MATTTQRPAQIDALVGTVKDIAAEGRRRAPDLT
jgi:hypothetical protein